MKINEKTLIRFATCDSNPADKSGRLWKRGEVNRAFQRRFFVLKGNLLFYFEAETSSSSTPPVGVVVLEGCTVELADDEDNTDFFGFKIVFHGDGKRTYVLAAETQSDLESWMKALACASYDYMKLMVAELQQQLRDLDDAESALTLQHEDKSVRRRNPFNDDEKEVEKVEWLAAHREIGEKILSDREEWRKRRPKDATSSLT